LLLLVVEVVVVLCQVEVVPEVIAHPWLVHLLVEVLQPKQFYLLQQVPHIQ
jgi:hypothetical protein